MSTFFLEMSGNTLWPIVLLILLLLVGPPLLLFVIGLAIRKKNPTAAKVLYIIAGVYLLVGLGICGGLMGGF